MIRLLRFLWTGSWHMHEYKIVKSGPIVNSNDSNIGTYYECRCDKCGKMKFYKKVYYA